MNRIIYKTNILFIFILLTVLSARSQTSDIERAIVRINNPSQTIVDTYYNSGNYEVWNYSPNNYLDVVLRKKEYENLISQGISVEIMQTETSIRENLIFKQLTVTKSSQNNFGYYTYETLLNDLQQISNENSSICQLVKLGESRGKEYYNLGYQAYANFNHDIWAVKISDNVAVEEDEPNIYFMGLHHPAEIVSLEVVMKILYDILENYSSDPNINDFVNNYQIWFVPLVNPDGHKIVTDKIEPLFRNNLFDKNNNHTIEIFPDYMILTESSFSCLNNTDLGINFINSLESMKDREFNAFDFSFRDAVKSIDGFPSDNSQSVYYLQTVMECVETKSRSYNDVDGKDLNRNYEYMNNTANTYAWSEPEVRAIRKLFNDHHFVAGFSYHSYGSLVLRPWDFDRSIEPPDYLALNTLGIELSENNPIALTPDPTDHYVFNDLYDALGTSTDYSYGEFGTFCYTIELEPKGVFAPTVENKDIICEANIPAAHYLLNRLSYSMLTGHITDQQTNQPVIAEIKVEGVDDFNNPNQKPIHKSDQKFGRYYRLLNPGAYNVKISANGYKEQTFANISITETGITNLDVKLLKDNMANNTDFDFTFEYNSYIPNTPPKFRFTGIIDQARINDVERWEWKFSSGSPNTSDKQVVDHTFGYEIISYITLTVHFKDGSKKSKSQMLYQIGNPY